MSLLIEIEKEVVLQIALQIGETLDLDTLLRSSVTTVLRFLNSTGAQVLQATLSEDNDSLHWQPVLTMPRPWEYDERHQAFITSQSLPTTQAQWAEWAQRLPVVVNDANKTRLLFALGQFGVLALEKERKGGPLQASLLRSLQPMLNKLGHHAVVCAELKRKNDALQASELRQRRVLDSLPTMVCEFLPDATLTYVNQSYCEFFNRTAEQLLGTSWLDLLPPEAREGARQAFLSLTPEQSILRYEHPVMTDDGLYWHEWQDQAFFDAQGQVVNLISVGSDITERKRLEETERREHADRNLIGQIATLALDTQDTGWLQRYVVRLLGETLDVSRAYIYVHRHDSNTAVNTAEWVAPGISSQIENMQHLPADTSLWWVTTLKQGETIRCADIATLPDTALVQTLEIQGVLSTITVPLLIGSRYCGFIGFDECRAQREWTQREEDMLAEVGRIVIGVWADEDLRRSEQRFKGILQNAATVAVQGYALDGTVRYWNRASERFYGYSAEQALGRNLLDLIIPPAMHAGVSAALQRMAETGEPIPAGEIMLRRKDGTSIPVYSSHTLVHVPGHEVELFCIDTDLSDIKSAEQKLRQLAQAVEQSPAAVTITDLHGTIVYVNRAFEMMSGYAAEDVLDQNPRLLKSGETPAEIYTSLWTTISAGQEWRGELCNRCKDGRLYWVSVSIAPVFDAEGRMTHYLAVQEDITQRKQAEAQQHRLQAQLIQAQKMETVGQLAGGVAHDFNNMLSVIIGYGQLVLSRLPEGNPLVSHVQDIIQAGERSAALTRQLLAFSRKQTLQPEVFDLNELTLKLEKMLRRLISEDIELELRLAENSGQVSADPGQIEQVIMNLVVNARDAMPTGGKLMIETECVKIDQCYADQYLSLEPGRYIRLSVSDTGVGMTPKTQAHIFEPFFTTKPQGKGTGIGLATVYGIIKQSNGHIGVYSELDYGTCFKVYLPQVNHISPIKTQPEPTLLHPRGTQTVLVVEDEPAVRRLAEGMLLRAGYQVLTAHDPSAALRLLNRADSSIDLLLTDVIMPQMNGFELAQQARLLHPDLRVLYMSGYPDNALAHHGVLDSKRHFIGKPFAHAALLRKVRAVLDAP